MCNRLIGSVLVIAALASLTGCFKAVFGPSREDVLAELRKEAESFKQKGDTVDPKLRLKSTWNIESVDVQELSGDRNRPYKGTIRFKIITTMHDADGSVTNDQLDKQFDYVYDVPSKRWLIQYTAAPVRR